MQQLVLILSRQHVIQYEFGPEFQEYVSKKAAGTLGDSYLVPLSEVLTEEQLRTIPVDNKVGELILGICLNSSELKEVLHSRP